MERETWSDLAIFAAILEAGSFTRAAVQLGVSPSALSHAMRGLEKRLDVRLINRTTRSLAPTAAGERLMARLGPAMTDIAGALEALAEDRERPAGRVRVTAHRTAALHAVLPRLGALARAYPDIVVELAVDDGLVDIVAARYDCGVRHEQMLHKDMICLKIGEPLRIGFFASPTYLASRHPRCAARSRRSSLPLLPLHVIGRDPSMALRAGWPGIRTRCPGEFRFQRRRCLARRRARRHRDRMPGGRTGGRTSCERRAGVGARCVDDGGAAEFHLLFRPAARRSRAPRLHRGDEGADAAYLISPPAPPDGRSCR